MQITDTILQKTKAVNTEFNQKAANISGGGRERRSFGDGRILLDKIMGKLVWFVTIFSPVLLLLIVVGLIYKSLPILNAHSLSDLLFSSDWKPFKEQFGFWPFILSTVYVTLISIVIAIPLSILTAVYLSEYAGKKFLNFAAPMLDILSGIPSVIFGIWGVLVIVPFITNTVAPAFGAETSGFSILAGGIVLAIMVFPIIVQVIYEVLKTVPKDLRDASLSLGANKWETIKKVLLKKASPGILAACILGFSRAFGETLAVLMVVGNVVQVPNSIFQAGYPLPALIANNYGEMMSIPMYDSALMFAALILLVIILVFNVYARWILNRLDKKLN